MQLRVVPVLWRPHVSASFVYANTYARMRLLSSFLFRFPRFSVQFLLSMPFLQELMLGPPGEAAGTAGNKAAGTAGNDFKATEIDYSYKFFKGCFNLAKLFLGSNGFKSLHALAFKDQRMLFT